MIKKLIILSLSYLISTTIVAQGVDDALPDRIGTGTHSSLAKSLASLISISLRSHGSADVFRYKNVTKVEYFNGSTWVDDTTESWKTVLDGVDGNSWVIDKNKIRFTIDLGSTWIRPSAVLVGQDYSTGGEREYSLIVESSSNQSSWSTNLSLTPTGSSTAQNIFMIDSQTNSNRYIRLTIESLANSSDPLNLRQVSGFTKRFVGLHENSSLPMSVSWDKNIGMGTTTPSEKLHVSSSTSGDAVLKIEADTDNNNEGDNARIEFLQDGGSLGAFMGFNLDWGGTNGIQGAEPGNLFSIGTRYSNTNDFNRLVINTMNGNVGIGTINPDEKLTVNGTIHSTEVKVDLTVPGPDYVFESDYDLRTLAETEEYIKANKHLPEIPSAKEMEANGVELGEMNMLLLKKIEELTLYQIEMMKHIEKQQKEIDSLKKEN